MSNPEADFSHDISRSTVVLNVSPHVVGYARELVVPGVASNVETVNLVSNK
jgi:hypothetical protein